MANINLCIIDEISSIEILDNNILAVTFFHAKNQNNKGDIGSPLNIQARALINHWWRLLRWLCPTTVQSWPDLSLWAMELPKLYFPLNVISESGSSHNGWPSSFWISSGVHLSRGRKSTMLRGGKVTFFLSQINGGKGGRTRLPVPQPDKVNLNLWSYLKQCIGKELTKITMPVHWNEPISLLQRITEYMNYASLLRLLILVVPFLILDIAQKCTNPSWSNAEATAGVRLLYIYQYLPHWWLVWSVKVVGC